MEGLTMAQIKEMERQRTEQFRRDTSAVICAELVAMDIQPQAAAARAVETANHLMNQLHHNTWQTPVDNVTPLRTQ